MQRTDIPEIDAATFHTDVQYLEALWQRVPMGEADMPLIDTGSDKGEPLVFVPILEHLEFVYARQVRTFGQRRRVIMYRRHETRTKPVGLMERAEELREVLDALGLECVDLAGHGDAAMVLFEFAARYPQRCRSLIIVAQGADYQIAPHPFIWLLHELFVRLPVEYILPAWFLRRTVINYIVANGPASTRMAPARGGPSINRGPTTFPRDQYIASHSQTVSPGSVLPRSLIEEQFRKIADWPFVYKYSVLPVIHYFDMRSRLAAVTMPILLINRANDVLACNGIGKEDFWEACISGRSGIRRITRFDAGPLSTQIAGEIAHFDPEAVDITREERLYLDRGTQFAIAAANLALQDAGLYGVLDEEERDHMGVYLGTAMASVEEGERIWLQFTGSGTRTPGYAMQDIVPATLLMSYVPASAIAIHHQLYGPCTVISTGCSAGADAIGEAFWAIQEGQADCMLAGGTDSAISYIGAYHMTSLPADGAPLQQLLRSALEEAEISPQELDYINPHGSSTPSNE